ncbi:hypothetical protein GCM10008904_25260 [Paraclostridium ghonii]|uniref:Uncharacterized protein n=1 Tax=Paraclostridium ghonii TaxID=29358 RepID=A0ABU0MYY9_9FIRM|nr:hypothetical protein [Paeniclostridium ghonii]MDQ0556123.1 hypothetical protein [Paeniclostridium ghonii]
MFYLLTSNKSERNNNIYPIGSELIKKVDSILHDQNSSNLVSNSDFMQSVNRNDIYKTKIKTRL